MPFLQPRYKKLAHNDTGSAVGHQAGVLIPKDLESYFPKLSGTVGASHPTLDVQITAELVRGSSHAGTVDTRYQYQTWGGTRRAERRITGNLQNLLGTVKGRLAHFRARCRQPTPLPSYASQGWFARLRSIKDWFRTLGQGLLECRR